MRRDLTWHNLGNFHVQVQLETGLRVTMIEDMAIGMVEAINNSSSIRRGATTVHQ